jgi:hypothetical protein
MLIARVFSVGLCSTLLLFSLLLLPAVPVSAQSIDAAEGIVDSTVTISGLTASTTYLILWDSTNYKSGTVPSTGIVTFTVPETYGGSHTVNVQNPKGTQVLSSSFTVLPSISISPHSGTVGESITVTGAGFADEEAKIRILYDDSSIVTGIKADSYGSWSSSFDAPASEGGVHTIDAYGSETEASDVDDVDFIIDPAITVSPTSCGGVGCAITVKGTGFAEGETSINVLFDDTKIKTGITADSNGSWSTTLNIPSTYSGTHSIDASGSSTDADDIDDLDFTVESGIGIDKTSAYVGDTVVVTGTGFGENESSIYVTFDGANQGSSIKADANGQWKTSLTVPAAVNGSHTIDARGSETSASSVEDTSLTILAQITLSPTGGNVGDSISISGTGFTGGKTVVVTFGAVSILDNISSDSSGSFTGTFNAPKGASGDIEVVAKDTNNVSATSVFAMEKTAPPVPQIKSPANGKTVGFAGKTTVDFEWTAVTDPSGVSYEIQVATDLDFKDIVFERSGLAVAEYKSIDTESLAQGQYSWRVRAVDGAGNTSDWTATTKFKAGRMSLTTIIIILVVLVVIILIVLRVRAIRSKR